MRTPTPHARQPVSRRRTALVVLAVITAATATTTLVSCSTDSRNNNSSIPAFSDRPSPPNTASFSGDAPSPLASKASEAVESARASASAAEASASAAASAFEASVSAEAERANKAAESALKDVKDRGNAHSDVSVTGRPRSDTGGFLAVTVNITNKTTAKASYAAQIDFVDSTGKVVETRFTGAEGLDPGERTQVIVVSRKPPEPVLTPRLTKAQRY